MTTNKSETAALTVSAQKVDHAQRIKNNIPGFILNFCLLFLTVVMLAPFAWVISTSLRSPLDSFRMPPSFLPTDFQYQNYITLFSTFPFATFIANSIRVAVVVVFANILVTTMAAYSFARIPFRGKGIVFMCVIAGLMVPIHATLVPQYIIVAQMGMVGTHWALILPAIVSPLNIFFVRQHMMTIPRSYEDAAYIDGAGHFRIYSQIFIPMSTNVIIMTSILSFLASWNAFIQPLIYIRRWEMMTIPLGMTFLSGRMGQGNVAVVLAGVVTSLVIPTTLYLLGQKHIMKGVALTGLKS